MEETANTHGGKRKGAGRPKGTVKGFSEARPQHQVRAYEEEWAVIKAFAEIVKKDPERAARMMETK
jgi:hypothetical protein